jgi:hypothetical protein
MAQAAATSASANCPTAAPSASPYSPTNLWSSTSLGAAPTASTNPFRFDFEPTYEDIVAEMGDFEPREGRGGPGTADVKFAIACPVYNYESGKVQVLQITQKSILKEIDQISQMEDYEDLLTWDFTSAKRAAAC